MYWWNFSVFSIRVPNACPHRSTVLMFVGHALASVQAVLIKCFKWRTYLLNYGHIRDVWGMFQRVCTMCQYSICFDIQYLICRRVLLFNMVGLTSYIQDLVQVVQVILWWCCSNWWQVKKWGEALESRRLNKYIEPDMCLCVWNATLVEVKYNCRVLKIKGQEDRSIKYIC